MKLYTDKKSFNNVIIFLIMAYQVIRKSQCTMALMIFIFIFFPVADLKKFSLCNVI